MGHAEKIRFGLMLALGVIVPGLAKYALTAIGYSGLGTIAWFSGYLVAVLSIWYVWLRPLDFHATTS